MAQWNLNETHSLVRSLFGHEQEKLVRESTRSVNERRAFSSYHFSEAMRLSKDFERKHMKGTTTILEIHALGAERAEAAFQRYMIKAGAHSVAAVQSLHAIPDIFAHAVYFCTGQNLKPHALADSKIALPAVVTNLRNDPRFAELGDPLASLQTGEAWNHLAAVSNTSKHRSVVRATYSEDWTGTRSNVRELHVAGFERRGKHYSSKSLRALLEPEYDRLLRTIITIGRELNACLQRVAP